MFLSLRINYSIINIFICNATIYTVFLTEEEVLINFLCSKNGSVVKNKHVQ